MYSYNGYIYPKLPEADGQCQYAILTTVFGKGDLVLSTAPLCIDHDGTLVVNGSDSDIFIAHYQAPKDGVHWEELGKFNIEANDTGIAFNRPVWANYDVYIAEDATANDGINTNAHWTATNELYLRGSDDYGGLSIRCPDSVTQGLFIVISCDSETEKYIDFTCELSGNSSPLTALMPNSSKTVRLQCARDEGASELTIEVASADEPGLTVSKKIAVIPRDWTYPDDDDPGGGGGGGGGWDETSLVTGIDLHVYPETVVPGGRATVEVSVNGIGNYSQAFTARLSGNSSPETELFSAGYSCNVWIDKEETAEYVLVTVASVQDPTITATEMIYIDYSGTEDEGTTQEQLQRAFWKGYAAARAYFQEAKVSASASIHIAREEAEPTTKAGKLRRSFWQGFVSTLIVAAAETEPETVPEGVLISSDGYILKSSDGLYLIAGVTDEPDAPGNAPVAYLYGPNKVRLPKMPDEIMFYPHIVLHYYLTGGTTIFACGFETEPYTTTYKNRLGTYDVLRVDSGNYRVAAWYETEPNQWFVSEAENVEDIATGYYSSKLDNLIWANMDIYTSAGDLFLPESEPEPVYE